MNPIIIKNLNHYFGKDKLAKQALFDIDLEIKAGEIVIMTGPSGSGKTTLLTLLGGLRRVQSGSLQTLGQELFQAKETDLVNIRRKIGYIFQAHNLLPFMTAQQNVQMSLELESRINSRKAAKMAKVMLADVGLKDRIKYFPEKLSGGQKQRVAIARALAPRPRLVLGDEPTAALDSQTGREVVNIMHRLVKEQNSTILLVTHDNRILDIADRIVHMEDGRLVNTEEREDNKKFFLLQENHSNNSENNLLPVTSSVEVEHSNNGKSHQVNNNLQLEPVNAHLEQENYTFLSATSEQHTNRLSDGQTSSNQSLITRHNGAGYNQNVTSSTKKPTYNIVCIDDSMTLLKSVESFLDHEVFNVTTIDNPVDALIETVSREPDIVLLDIMMPNINGHEFCALLRQNKRFKETPIIMITSLSDDKNRDLAKSQGASDYLQKPFKKIDLLKILFKFL